MANEMDQLVSSLIKAIRDDRKSGTYGFTRNAEVVSINEDGAFVKFKGSDIVTPVTMAISAKVGDTVTTRVSDGRAWVTGNVTDPPKARPDKTDLPLYSLEYDDSKLKLIENEKSISEVEIRAGVDVEDGTYIYY